MGISDETLAAARKYVQDSLAGVGALAGKSCQIQSIAPITDGNRVTFLWVDDNGVSHTDPMDVMNGAQGDPGNPGAPGEPGQNGVGIKALAINSSNHLIITLTDDNTVDAGEIPAVQSDWNQSESSAPDFIKNKPTLGTAASKDSTNAVTEDSADLIESGAVFTGLAAKADKTDVATDIQKVYNVMGQNGAKNLLLFDLAAMKANNTDGTWSGNVYTLNDVTFTANDDGTISTSGTASAGITFTYYLYPSWKKTPTKFLSGCPSGGSLTEGYCLRAVAPGQFSRNDEGTGIFLDQDFTGATYINITVQPSTDMTGLVFKPMIRLANDTDNTYQPYAKTNRNLTGETDGLTDNVMKNGCVNLLKVTASTITTHGITFTVGDDGVIDINGTADANDNAYIQISNISFQKFLVPGQRYILSGSVPGVPISDGYMYTSYSPSINNANGESTEFTYNGENIPGLHYVVVRGKTYNHKKLKPMITLATQTNSDYEHFVPYAKTNRELTEELTVKDYSSQVTVVAEEVSYNQYSSQVLKLGKLVQVNLVFSTTGAIAASSVLFTLPNDLLSARNSAYRVVPSSDLGKAISVNPINGNVTLNEATTGAIPNARICCTYII